MGTKIILPALIGILILAGFGFTDAFAADAEITLKAKGQPFQALDDRVAALEQGNIPDSFFDVFYEIDVSSEQCPNEDEIPRLNGDGVECSSDFQVDSFFDIFYEIKRTVDIELVALSLQADSFFDVFFDVTVDEDGSEVRNTIEPLIPLYGDPDFETNYPGPGTAAIDSFFDIFVEIDARDRHFDTEIVAMDLRGQSCDTGKVMIGIEDDGDIICVPLDTVVPPPPVLELCNGVDDDANPDTLDGVDEPWFGQACDGPDADFCFEGAFMCTDGGQVCSDTTGDSEEIPRDGRDNDCDGEVDEGFVDVSGTWTLRSPISGVCEAPNIFLPDGSFTLTEIILAEDTDSTEVTFVLLVGVEGIDIIPVPIGTNYPGFLYPTFDMETREFRLSGTFDDESHVRGVLQTEVIPVSTSLGTYDCRPINTSFAASR